MMLVMNTNILTYAHPDDLNTRFKQLACDALPAWAVQVRDGSELPMKVVNNLMSGKPIVIAENTPRSCDPSTELYWSM